MLFVVRFIVFNFILLNQVFAFEDPIIDDLKNKIDEVTEKPSWIFKRITSEDHYFFVGMGSAEDKVEAMKSSRLDALSILSLKVHVSIDQNQVFDSVYASNQDTKNDDSQSFTEKVYNKIQIKTNSLVEGAEFTEYFYENIGIASMLFTS